MLHPVSGFLDEFLTLGYPGYSESEELAKAERERKTTVSRTTGCDDSKIRIQQNDPSRLGSIKRMQLKQVSGFSKKEVRQFILPHNLNLLNLPGIADDLFRMASTCFNFETIDSIVAWEYLTPRPSSTTALSTLKVIV
jgi:hypothetical protein